jgi:hypothetical protein
MKTIKWMIAVALCLFIALPCGVMAAPVFDGYFQVEQKKNANVWKAEDKQINER